MLLWECARAKHLDYMQTNTENEIETMKERKAVLTAKIKTAEKDIESLAIRKERANELYVSGEINRNSYDKMNGKTAEIENGLKADIKNYTAEIKAINNKVNNLTNFDIDAFVNLGLDIANTESKNQMKEIILQHIKECFVERMNIDGKKAIQIEINCYDGSIWKYMYFYTYKQKEKQLYYVCKNGSLQNYYLTEEKKEEYKKYIEENKLNEIGIEYIKKIYGK